MKRKYEEFINPAKYTLKRHIFHEYQLILKRRKKDPMIQFIAIFRGYLVRKLYLYRIYPFYS
jgi:hypothetical protein